MCYIIKIWIRVNHPLNFHQSLLISSVILKWIGVLLAESVLYAIRKYTGKIGFQVHTRTTKLVQHTPEKHPQLTDCRKRDLKFGYKGLTFWNTVLHEISICPHTVNLHACIVNRYRNIFKYHIGEFSIYLLLFHLTYHLIC